MNNRYTDVIQSLITIMQDPMKNRFDEHVRFKIFGFDNQHNPSQT